MKKVFWMIIFSVMIYSSRAQITYEASYTGSLNYYMPSLVYFNHMSPKWMNQTDDYNIYLYYLNHSLFRHIIIPAQQSNLFKPYYISDDLFDNDSTNIEYLITTYSSSNPNYVKVYREDGTLLFSRDSVVVYPMPWAMPDYNLFASDSGTKLVLDHVGVTIDHMEIYSLPGRLPCPMSCGGTSMEELAQMGIQNYGDQKSALPYPNPSSNQIHIPIELNGETSGEIIFYDMAGAEVKRYKVDRTFSDLILSTSDLSAGSYYYQLVTQHSKSEGKKLVVIK